MFGTNWKTNLSGIATILAGLSAAAHGFSVDDMSAVYACIPALVTGVGLLMAKDADVTGGTVPQTEVAAKLIGVPLPDSAKASK